MGSKGDLVIYATALAALLTATSAVFLIVTLVWRGVGVRSDPDRLTVTDHEAPGIGLSSALDRALDEAAKRNGYRVGLHGAFSPHVHVRYTPRSYDAAIGEITRHYRDGRAISIELSGLAVPYAVRLVDFCSGLTAGTAGWIFRVTDTALIVTPPVS